MYDYTQFSQETKVIETNEIRPWIEVGLCKERKPKRPNPETTETGNSRLISRITNNYIVDARSLAYHLDKYRPNVVSRKAVYYLTADNFVNYLIILLHIINFLNNAGFV
jgi:hypothetical protein